MPIIPSSVNRPWIVKRAAHEGHKDTGFNYSSRRWKKVRDIFIRQNPLCKSCAEKGLTVPARVVDHIIPISQGGDAWSFRNFQSLCDHCHNIKSAKEKS